MYDIRIEPDRGCVFRVKGKLIEKHMARGLTTRAGA